jgi:hypothetical protein
MTTIAQPDRAAELPALDEARRLLTARLHRNPADFAATKELQAVIALSADIRAQISPSESESLVHAGLSNAERTRIWFRTGVRGPRRHPQTIARGNHTPAESTDVRPVVAVP